MQGVTHPMKEEKMGFWRGARARLRMYWEIAQSLTSRGQAHQEAVEEGCVVREG